MAFRPQEKQPSVSHLQPPQSLDAERAVLGAILKDAEALSLVLEVFDTPSNFYAEKHRVVFQAALDLYSRSEPSDITTVAEELLKKKQLDKIGGRVYLVELAESVVSTANVASHAKIVQEKAVLRYLITASNETVKNCYSLDQPVESLLDKVESAIFDISAMRTRQGFVPIKGLIRDTLENIDAMQLSEGGLIGLKTGFTGLDERTLGMHKGDLVVIAGRPSMGKTAFALNIAESVAIEKKVGVGIFSIEMSRDQLVFRMLCGRAGLDQQKVKSGKLKDSEWQYLTHAGNVLSPSPIYIDDSPTLSVLEMRAKARRLKRTHDIGLIIVDYIQLMHATGRQENRQQEISSISRGIKALAKEIEVPVIAISQLSRQVEQRGGERIPQLSDLRESGAIEQDADVVLFVHRPEYYLSADERREEQQKAPEDTVLGKANLIIAKQRNGPTGTIELAFVSHLVRFENLERFHHELPPGASPVGGEPDPF